MTSKNSPTQDAAPAGLEEPNLRRPRLLIVIDTEEEFDWGAPFDRTRTSVRHMAAASRAQTIFDEYGLHPVYVVDYPVASQEEGYAPLKAFVDGGRATIGAHLHPWVNPPHEEEVCVENSFAGNLPPALEEGKLRVLTDRIEASFGERPVIYKAGRYGFGPRTPEILLRLGFQIDLSFSPPFDFSVERGPDYSLSSNHPQWLDPERSLLEVPTSGAYTGWCGKLLPPAWIHRIYGQVTHPRARWTRAAGILSRLRGLSRIRLSPEGFSLEDLKRLTRSLLNQGVRVFSFGFHSPSLEPGHTPYVRSREDLDRFLGLFRDYFDFFLGDLEGVPGTPGEVRRELLRENPPSSGTSALQTTRTP